MKDDENHPFIMTLIKKILELMCYGGGTGNNFFSYNGNTYMFRFRPASEDLRYGGTISGNIKVNYSGGGQGIYNFSYSVSGQ